jgi:type IV pilus assembly protein PilB
VTQSAARQPIPVGKYFLDRGIISQEQLDIALKHRGEFGLKLGQSLVELGFVTESDMVEALRHQSRFPCIHLTDGIVDARVAAKLGEEPSRRLKALALNQIADHTTVALEDPSDPAAIDELARLLGTRVFPVYGEPSVILDLVDRHFGQGRSSRAPTAARPPRVEPPPRQEAPEREAAPAIVSAPDDRAVVDAVRSFLQNAFEQGASDIHLEPRRDELAVRFRVHGVMHEHTRLPGAWAPPAIACLKALAHLDGEHDGKGQGPAAREGRIPFVFRKSNYEVRITILQTLHGESVVLHVQGGQRFQRDLEHLALGAEQLAQVEPLLAARGGLFLVTGPAGSGCRTTLHALLTRLATQDKKAVALADQVVHEVEGVLYVRAPAGLDPAARVQMLLGQDPDLVVVPEIDGRETARSLLEAALSGRSVLAVLRSRSALEAVTRLVHLGCEPYLLSDALRGVIGQRIARRICAGCKAPIVPDEALCKRLGLAGDGATYFEGEGCAACHGTGFAARIGLFEVLSVTNGLRRELERGAPFEALAQAARADGFVNLREHALRLARAGLTTLHEVLVATAWS